MKVLFAVNNEKISESIVKRYQKNYKEIISSKNVYYFNAIIKELQKDKSYDRIVISEDLEPFSSEDHESIDKFIFDKLDKISDEAYSTIGNDIPIILICEDRRRRPEPILVKIFGIGVYNAIIGQDRSIDNVCELLNKPRSKKEAKRYYKIDSESVEYKPENEGDVSEDEIQNILSHYKRLGKNEEKYVKSFESIASQYNEEQLRLIITFLPNDVINVLERSSSKYRQLMGLNPRSNHIKSRNTLNSRKYSEPKIEVISKPVISGRLNSPVIIPSSVNPEKAKRVIRKAYTEPEVMEAPIRTNNIRKKAKSVQDEIVNQTEKKGRGRPPKIKEPQEEVETKTPKRGRGRPPKNKDTQKEQVVTKTSKRGRPRKKINENENKVEDEDNDEIFLPFETDDENNNELLDFKEVENVTPEEYSDDDDNVLPGYENDEDEDVDFEDYEDEEDDEDEDTDYEDYEDYEDDEDEDVDYEDYEDDDEEDYEDDEDYEDNEDYYEDDEEDLPEVEDKDDEYELPGFDEDVDDEYIEETSEPVGAIKNVNFNGINPRNDSNKLEQVNYMNSQMNVNIDNLLSSDKKIVSFVGTSKNGTSFLINNLAELLSEKGIKTAILDLTQNRNAYYIYTDNREELRNIAYRCIESLRKGIPEGIQVNKNLTVYTSLPDDIEGLMDANLIIETLLNNYSLVLLDCDFMTDLSYFNISQEIYLVQSLDVLTIQPLTAFLRELKARNILDSNKLKVVINKYVKSQITQKMVIGGMSSYNDPSMSYMTELFDRDKIKCLTIPFEIQNYSRYLEELVDCKISLKGYSKIFMKSLEELANSVFPLIYNPKGNNQNNYNNYFSNSTNSTLNKMKKKY